MTAERDRKMRKLLAEFDRLHIQTHRPRVVICAGCVQVEMLRKWLKQEQASDDRRA